MVKRKLDLTTAKGIKSVVETISRGRPEKPTSFIYALCSYELRITHPQTLDIMDAPSLLGLAKHVITGNSNAVQ